MTKITLRFPSDQVHRSNLLMRLLEILNVARLVDVSNTTVPGMWLVTLSIETRDLDSVKDLVDGFGISYTL